MLWINTQCKIDEFTSKPHENGNKQAAILPTTRQENMFNDPFGLFSPLARSLALQGPSIGAEDKCMDKQTNSLLLDLIFCSVFCLVVACE